LKSTSEKAVFWVVIATGISSVVTQLYIIREFLTLFAGNEFVIALIIFNWLVLGGTGTLLSQRIARREKLLSAGVLGWLTLALAAIPPIQILLVRYLRDMVFIHGSSVGFYPTLFYIFFTIAPYALLIGFVLPYSLFVLRKDMPQYSGTRIYLLDNIGDVTGGALFSFVLVYLLTPLKALLLADFVLLISACMLFWRLSRMRIAVALSACIVFGINISGIFLEEHSLSSEEGELVHYEETFFGRIVVQKSGGQVTLFEDGIPIFSSENLIMAEEAVHYGLSQVESPKNTLIISSVAGMMEEVEKYKLKSVDYLQLDPAVSRAEFRFGLLKKIPCLKVINADGRMYLQQTNNLYDVIIMNLPEPETFQVNRFFTREFFMLVKKHLIPNGVLSFSVQGFDNYLSEPHRQKVSSLYNTLHDHFSNIIMLPGLKIYFICSDAQITDDIPELLEKRDIATSYISSYFSGNITKPRIDYLAETIDASTPVNSDISPMLMRIMFFQWFEKYGTSPFWFIAFTGLAALLYLARRTAEEFVLFTTGATTMGAEILIIFIFQVFFGYVYLKVGMIVTVFLAGLLPGALCGERLKNKSPRVLVMTDACIIVMMVLIITIMKLGAQGLPEVVFYAVAFTISVLCGFQFPVALYLRGGDNPAAAKAFSADLIGAAAGTLIMSIALIPYLGLLWSAAGLIVLKSASIIVVGMRHGKTEQATVSHH
jgi:spermidine synthase